MPTDLTSTWEAKISQIAAGSVSGSGTTENILHSKIASIDGGTATLMSKLKSASGTTYAGFATAFTLSGGYTDYEWLQFITRQLVVGGSAKTGKLVIKANTHAYALVDSTSEVTDFSVSGGSAPSNWSTCWNVDTGIGGPSSDIT